MPKTVKKPYKNLNNFEYLKTLNNNNNNFSHQVYFLKKFKNGTSKSQWYAKFLGENKKEVILETLAQEFYRLILSQQPKTRWVCMPGNEAAIKQSSEYYVISKEISDFDEHFFLFPKKNKLILDNSITGLAATQVLALWLNEIDFKAGNVGVDGDGKVIKIDGGLSLIKLNPKFNNLHEGKNLDITKADLKTLPNLVNYEACNWLNQIHWNLNERRAIKKEPTKLDKKIKKSTYYKNELYQTILRIISMPDELIQFFIQSYIANPSDITKFSNFIIVRKQQLALAAEQISAFNKYRQSNPAREEIIDFLKYLRTFKTMRKFFLLTEFENQYKINIEGIILRNMTQEFTLKNFAKELDTYHQNLNQAIHEEINFDLLVTENFILDPNREAIISDLSILKEFISDYLTLPTIFKKRALVNLLTDFVENLKADLVMKEKNFIVPDLIESINKVLFVNDSSKK
ncbi:hypothetical protein [Rickettsiella endosymbiont of Aleochara curtula]|uniref:hypothetical protein n=1 Tax=Rickettsiella endosymbiont of Aleochara curtula TaxID=3077936 RepID=UPI00313D3CC4